MHLIKYGGLKPYVSFKKLIILTTLQELRELDPKLEDLDTNFKNSDSDSESEEEEEGENLYCTNGSRKSC